MAITSLIGRRNCFDRGSLSKVCFPSSPFPSHLSTRLLHNPWPLHKANTRLQLTQSASGVPTIGSYTANDGAFYAESDLETDDDVTGTVTKYVVNISKQSLSKLLELYPEDEFTSLPHPGEKATAQYFRAAQINRDLWFTCPVVDFTWQYARFDPTTPVRVYEWNQSRFDPIWAELGHPEWRVAHLADLPYFFNEELIGGGDNTTPDNVALSKLFAGTIAAFAYSKVGDPTDAPANVQTLREWPITYSNAKGSKEEFPSEWDVKVIGGPYGEGAGDYILGTEPRGAVVLAGRRPYPVETLRKRVEEDKKTGLEAALKWERVLERCKFINGITEEVGV